MKKNLITNIIIIIAGISFVFYEAIPDFVVWENIFLTALIFFLILKISDEIIKAHQKNSIISNKLLLYIPFLIVVICQKIIGYEDIKTMLGVAFILFATLFLFNYYDKMSNRNSTFIGIIPIGIAIGLLGIVRQDMVMYMWGLFFWAMFWAGMADVEGRGLTLFKRAIKGFTQGLFLTMIMIIIIGIGSLCYIIYFSWEIYVEFIVNVFDFSAYKITFQNPFSLTGIIFYLPLLLAITSLIFLIINNRRKIIRANTPLFWKEMLIINLTLNIFNYNLIGSGLSNILPPILFASFLIYNYATIKNVC